MTTGSPRSRQQRHQSSPLQFPVSVPFVESLGSMTYAYCSNAGVDDVITCAVEGDRPVGSGDALRLEQVVQNLLQNALKYSEAPDPVVVTLAARRDATGGPSADSAAPTTSVRAERRNLPPPSTAGAVWPPAPFPAPASSSGGPGSAPSGRISTIPVTLGSLDLSTKTPPEEGGAS